MHIANELESPWKRIQRNKNKSNNLLPSQCTFTPLISKKSRVIDQKISMGIQENRYKKLLDKGVEYKER